MLKLDLATPSPEPSYPPTLAALSRNASVISTSSSDSGPSPTLATPRPRPVRTFSSPRSRSPQVPSPRGSKPPSYLTKELGLSESPKESRFAHPNTTLQARSKSRNRNTAITVQDFTFGTTLGEGSYSTVMRGTYLRTGQQYAIKVLDKGHLIRNNKMQTALAEKNALVRLGAGHPGIVRLYYAFHDEWSLYFVIDLAKNGEMQSLISRMGSLYIKCAQYYAAQIVDAVDYMHSKGVIHRDLKPENLLLDEAYRIKITDFGTGKILEPGMERAKTFVGTAQYVSPELLEANETSKSSDFWALGCIIYQMIAGRFAFQGLSEYLTWQKIKQLEYTFPEGFDQDAMDLVQKLLVRNPAERLGAGLPGSPNDIHALRTHTFFSTINWDTLWTDPAPPIEPGLVKKEHPLAAGHDQGWEDVGSAWDDLVGSEGHDLEDDELSWASDGQGPEYHLVRQNGYAGGLQSQEIGPMGETPRYVLPRGARDEDVVHNEEAVALAGYSLGVGVDEPTKAPTAPQDSPSTGSPTSSSEGSPMERMAAGFESLHLPVPSRASPGTSNKSAHTLHENERDERGRNTTPTPVQGNGPSSDTDISSLLRKEEIIIFRSTVESRSLRRRASRLLPIPVSPIKPKTRQLILTSHRLLCLKQRQKGNDIVSIKSELSLRPSDKVKEKGKEKESRSIITSVEHKGEREFVVLTSSKSHSYAAQDPGLASTWVAKINDTLVSHGRQPSKGRT